MADARGGLGHGLHLGRGGRASGDTTFLGVLRLDSDDELLVLPYSTYTEACHYRNGVLLTPITADVIAELITTGTLAEVAAPFTLARFSPVAAEVR